MKALSPEEHLEQVQRVRELRGVLCEFLAGRTTRLAIREWTQTRWPDEVGQLGPFRQGSARSIFASLLSVCDQHEDDHLVRTSDIAGYLRWLDDGDVFRGDNEPLAVLKMGMVRFAELTDVTPTRYWLDGLGFYEEARFASPATGRAFHALAAFGPNHPEGAERVQVTKLRGDAYDETLVDLFGTLAIDDVDLDYVHKAIDLTVLPKWELWRLDDNGQEVQVNTFRSYAKAVAEQQRFEARGHRQTYWVRS